MEHVSTITGALSIAKAAGDISKKLYELGKSVKDRETRQHIDEIVDQLRDLKQSASELEDDNRALREKLRFRSDEYDFRTPFWYSKQHPNRPLCAKCFAKGIAAPMGEPGLQCDPDYRRCLVCSEFVPFRQRSEVFSDPAPDHGEWS
jgi:hypothetical protein